MKNSRHKNPHHPESALADYLQDLLSPQAGPDVAWGSHEVSVQPARETRSENHNTVTPWAEPLALDSRVFTPQIKVAPAPPPEPAMLEAMRASAAPAPVTLAPPAAYAPEPEQKVEQKVEQKGKASGAPVALHVAAPQPEIRKSRWVEGRPEWAQKPFDCLLFKVAGLKLAVPLVLLGAVHPLDRDLTPLVGRPRWFMGLATRGDRSTRVVDTARWVMPDRYRPEARVNYGFVIRLDDSEWGLACDEVAQSFRLKPEEVKWRSEEGRRPWLAGTVKSHMCALLDVGEFARMLARAEKTQELDLES